MYETVAARPSEMVRSIDARLLETTDDVFGESPGAPFARLARALFEAGGPRVTPDLRGIDALDGAIVARVESELRLLPPLVFQALCDAVATAAARALGARVEWAVAEPDEHGLASPPLVRVASGATHAHVPVGLELLRFAVMPLQPSESVPPLSDWVRAVLAGSG